MPRRRVLTEKQLSQLFALPVREADLIQHYTLSRDDIAIIERRRRPQNRLGFALQLCALRYPGRHIAPGEVVPLEIVRFIGEQLDVFPDDLADYAVRAPTRYEQLDTIRDLFGFSSFAQPHRSKFVEWLVPLALTTVNGFQVAEALMVELRRRKIAAPGGSVIEHIVAEALVRAERHVADLIARQLSDQQKQDLDRLLDPKEGTPFSGLAWSRQPPAGVGHRPLTKLIDQITFLRALHLGPDALAAIHLNRARQLAREGSRLTAQHLRVLSPARRRATVLATVLETIPKLTDEAIGVYDRLIGRLFRRAERRATEALQRDARVINDKLRLLTRLGDALLTAKDAGSDPIEAIGNIMPWQKLAEAVAETKELIRPDTPDYLTLAERSHALRRQVGPAFLAAFEFNAVPAASNVVSAIEVLRRFYAGDRRTFPKDAPSAFIRRSWRHAALKGGKIKPRAYELCLFAELRDRLRAGNIWVTGSRQYRAVEDQLLSRPVFAAMREAGSLPIAVTADVEAYLADRREQLDRRLRQVAEKAGGDHLEQVRVRGTSLKISPLEAITPAAAEELAERLYAMIPKVRITELLAEVSGWTDLTECFTHLHSGIPAENAQVVLTAVLADATNLGLTRMADACNIATYKQLVWTAGWHIREETYGQALARIVETQQAEPLAGQFGAGRSSSSDGQLFSLAGRGEATGEVNPHKGTEPSISFYTHVSDRYAPFHTKVISATEGEAAHVIDGLLYHETDLDIAIHHTDGGGVSDHVFALCHLLGFRFAPRIPNLNDRKLYTFGATT